MASTYQVADCNISKTFQAISELNVLVVIIFESKISVLQCCFFFGSLLGLTIWTDLRNKHHITPFLFLLCPYIILATRWH